MSQNINNVPPLSAAASRLPLPFEVDLLPGDLSRADTSHLLPSALLDDLGGNLPKTELTTASYSLISYFVTKLEKDIINPEVLKFVVGIPQQDLKLEILYMFWSKISDFIKIYIRDTNRTSFQKPPDGAEHLPPSAAAAKRPQDIEYILFKDFVHNHTITFLHICNLLLTGSHVSSFPKPDYTTILSIIKYYIITPPDILRLEAASSMAAASRPPSGASRLMVKNEAINIFCMYAPEESYNFLISHGLTEDAQRVINSLPNKRHIYNEELFNQIVVLENHINDSSRNNVYTDPQNVHNKTINENVICIANNLIQQTASVVYFNRVCSNSVFQGVRFNIPQAVEVVSFYEDSVESIKNRFLRVLKSVLFDLNNTITKTSVFKNFILSINVDAVDIKTEPPSEVLDPNITKFTYSLNLFHSVAPPPLPPDAKSLVGEVVLAQEDHHNPFLEHSLYEHVYGCTDIIFPVYFEQLVNNRLCSTAVSTVGAAAEGHVGTNNGLRPLLAPTRRAGNEGDIKSQIFIKAEQLFIATNNFLLYNTDNIDFYLEASGIKNAKKYWSNRDEIISAFRDTQKSTINHNYEPTDRMSYIVEDIVETNAEIRNFVLMVINRLHLTVHTEFIEQLVMNNVRNIKLYIILNAVWKFAQRHAQIKDILIRLRDELSESLNTCSTGILARLVNTIQGFTDNPSLIIIIDLKEHLRAKILYEIDALLKQHHVDILLDPTKCNTIIQDWFNSKTSDVFTESFYSTIERFALDGANGGFVPVGTAEGGGRETPDGGGSAETVEKPIIPLIQNLVKEIFNVNVAAEGGIV